MILLISDSLYVVNIVSCLEVVGKVNLKSTIGSLIIRLRDLILQRSSPYFVQHIRAHTGLPGPLAEGNDLVDRATHAHMLLFANSPVTLAQEFHSQFHVNSKTLSSRFKISRADARDIVKNCSACAPLLPQSGLGVNPRGLRPLHLWQMDITHFSDFGKLKYIHLSIDTASGIIFASLHSGEKARHVIAHCFEAWGAWGQPTELKTDNGPAYTSTSFISFCKMMGVQLTHGLPYNPQGQGIVERAHRTLKECLIKQKGGIAHGSSPRERLAIALFTLNFLTEDAYGKVAADRHVNPEMSPKGTVMWKDVLTGEWNGPDPVLVWARGSVCVFPQDQRQPLWVPERLTRIVQRRHGLESTVPEVPDNPTDKD